MKYITRFAPSPTGFLHVGGMRTAIFGYLAAKSTNGRFLLRIEDTDRERFVPEGTAYIHDCLKWMGLSYDGEVVYQSDRLHVYQEKANELLEKGRAYKCFCTKERLDNLKKNLEEAKKPPVYDRCCLALSKEDIDKKTINGDPFVIRFKIPETPEIVSWNDKIRDEIKIATNILEDFIIIKSDGWPTYNFANIIDDHESQINLVIRGDEFVPSTPKHILLYHAFGWEPPEFAHVPVIIGKDKAKLSKRNGDTALLDYKKKGYLPETLLNFLVLLGWNPGTTDEIFSLSELEKIFSVERIGKAPAVFDTERLDWMNGIYIRNLSPEELKAKIIEFDSNFSNVSQKLLDRIIIVEQSRLKTLAEFKEISGFYFTLPKYSKDMLVFKKSTPEATKKGLEAILVTLSSISDNSWLEMKIEDFNGLLSKVVEDNELKNADVFWPVRVALSGQEKSASPAELLWVFGKEESLKRIKNSL